MRAPDLSADLVVGHAARDQVTEHLARIRALIDWDRHLLCIVAIQRCKDSARMHHCQLYKAERMEQAESASMSLVGERIRALRQQKGWSKGHLAKLANIAPQTVMRIEDGETPQPTQHTVERIARALGVTHTHLWGPVPQAQEPPPNYNLDQIGVDIPLLTNVLEGLESFLAAHDLRIPARKKAEIAGFLYQHFAAHGAMQEDAFVNFMKLVLQP